MEFSDQVKGLFQGVSLALTVYDHCSSVAFEDDGKPLGILRLNNYPVVVELHAVVGNEQYAICMVDERGSLLSTKVWLLGQGAGSFCFDSRKAVDAACSCLVCHKLSVDSSDLARGEGIRVALASIYPELMRVMQRSRPVIR